MLTTMLNTTTISNSHSQPGHNNNTFGQVFDEWRNNNDNIINLHNYMPKSFMVFPIMQITQNFYAEMLKYAKYKLCFSAALEKEIRNTCKKVFLLTLTNRGTK